jgi:hypothetical protein
MITFESMLSFCSSSLKQETTNENILNSLPSFEISKRLNGELIIFSSAECYLPHLI